MVLIYFWWTIRLTLPICSSVNFDALFRLVLYYFYYYYYYYYYIIIIIIIIWIIRLRRIISLSCENGHYNRTWQNDLPEEKLEGLYENKVTKSRLYRDEKLGHFTKFKFRNEQRYSRSFFIFGKQMLKEISQQLYSAKQSTLLVTQKVCLLVHFHKC